VTSDDITRAAQEIEDEEKTDAKIQQEVDNDNGGLSASQLKSISESVEADNKIDDPNGAYAGDNAGHKKKAKK
jgi:hypothetical protein